MLLKGCCIIWTLLWGIAAAAGRDPCLINPCHNNGTCINLGNSQKCQCLDGFEGRYCQTVFEDTLNCLYLNGHCEQFCDGSGSRRRCYCADGYVLGDDGRQCVPNVEYPCGRVAQMGQNQTAVITPRMVGTYHCPKGHCPWQALLTENHMFSCGAIILSDRWILTAAHCVYQKPSTMLHITVGEHDIREDEKTEQRRRVLKVVCHEDYNVTSSDSDLALLKLHRPVKLGRHVVPICLPARNSTFTQTLETVRNSTVSGWGRLAQFGSTSRYLQRLQLPRVPVQECRLHSGLNITKNMICAGFKRGGPDACGGNGGGPLVTQYKKTWFLTGVVSWGKGCGQENMYGVYTKVTNFLDWIENVMATG
ncbi:coagulation factor VII-like [Oreochromis aureus]|uniref:coagulation factor VII-like n=1 Tax=Oreochromis aureus TaxID=47969 RepID=UPI001952C45A|nr:coagulation factor VII-like [Oreochromis aureus]